MLTTVPTPVPGGIEPEADAVFTPEVVDRLFAGLDGAAALLLAVSGGPDSMALLSLAVGWAGRLGTTAPALHVATVDHGLRAAARDEAALVAATAAGFALSHRTLVATGIRPTTRVQEKARDARYALLVAQARAIGARHILTAHHADDQVETILMRLGRGSGIRGLAGMHREMQLAPDVILARPLLSCRKADLVELCRREALRWVDDPSNVDSRFTRTHLRAKAAALRSVGLDTVSLARLSRRMARADAALEVAVDRLEGELALEKREGLVEIRLPASQGLEAEFALRLVGRAIAHVVPDGSRVRLDRLEALTDGLLAARGEGRPHRATLGGARIALSDRAILTVTPEPPRSRGRRTSLSPSLRPN